MVDNDQSSIAYPNLRRNIVGLISGCLLVLALILFLALGPKDGIKSVFVGVSLRLGLVLGSIWLAWPQVVRLANFLPRMIVIAILIGLGTAVVFSRLLPIVVAILVVAIVLQLAFRFFKSKQS